MFDFIVFIIGCIGLVSVIYAVDLNSKIKRLKQENLLLKEQLNKNLQNQGNANYQQQANYNNMQQRNNSYQQQVNYNNMQQGNNSYQQQVNYNNMQQGNNSYQQQAYYNNMQQGNNSYQQQAYYNNMQQGYNNYQQQAYYNNMQQGNNSYQQQAYYNNIPQENFISPEELEKQKREKKNTSILVTGAIFLVLSAIVFLTSTWSFTPNIVKSIVLFLLIGVFWGASIIAQNKFHLPKASKAFFYLSMSYIPICLISCSIFGLFGKYFSINGDGKFIYLTLALGISATIYALNYRQRKDKILLCGTLLCQILTVILFTLIFSKNLLTICIAVLIYNCVLLLVSEKFEEKNIFYYFSTGIVLTISCIAIFYMFSPHTSLLILLPILAINFLILKKVNSTIYSCAFNIVLYLIGIYLSLVYLKIPDDLRLVVGLVYSLGMFAILDLISNKTNDINLKNSSLIINIFYILILIISSYTYKCNFMKPVIFWAMESIFLMIAYFRKTMKPEEFNIYGYLAPCSILVTLTQALDMMNADFYLYIVLALIFVIINNIKMPNENMKTLKRGIFITTQVFIAILYIFGINECEHKFYNLIIAFIVSIFLVYNNLQQKQNKYLRIIPEIGFLFILISDIFYAESVFQLILLWLTTIGLTGLSSYNKKISVDTIFSVFYVLTMISLYDNVFIKEIIFIIWSLISLCLMSDSKGKNLFTALLSGGVFALYNSCITKIGLAYYSFRAIGITILAIALLKVVIKKYVKPSTLETFEYWTLSIIYFVTLFLYEDSLDGMTFTFFLVVFLMFSYIKKYGAVFITNLIAIIVNVFVLTRELWFSIPWWIYLLVVGALLIGFAIKNESDEKKGKIDLKGKLKNLKDRIEQ